MPGAWHDFYMLLGTASAALVALLFVAASVGAGLIDPARSTATRTYMSPIIFHYTCVLFLSLMMLVPDMTARRLAVIVALVALAGFGFAVAVFLGVMRSAMSDLADRFGYGASPLAAYAAALLAAGFLWTHSTRTQHLGRRARSVAPREYPQRLGSDPDLRTPARERPAARLG